MIALDITQGSKTRQIVILDDIWDDQDGIYKVVHDNRFFAFVLKRPGFAARVTVLGYALKTPGARLSSAQWLDRGDIDAVRAALDYRDGDCYPDRIVRNKPEPAKVDRAIATIARQEDTTTIQEPVLEMPPGFDWN